MIEQKYQFWIGLSVILICGFITATFGIPAMSDVFEHVQRQPVIDAKQDAKISQLERDNRNELELLEELQHDTRANREILLRLEVKMQQLEVVDAQ